MSSGRVSVEILPMWTDNYAYLVIDAASKHSAIVDPGEGDRIVQIVKDMESNGLCTLKQLWCTHKHADHAGGNDEFKRAFPDLEIIGTQYEHIPALTKGVGEDSQFNLGDSLIKVMYVPCHTAGHVAFLVDGFQKVLFPGDTLFVGGCGRFFEGTGAEMLTNMDRFAQLPKETLVYPAHEYTESNLKFLNSISPNLCGGRYREVTEMRKQGTVTVPTTIGKELEYNLFMKCHESHVQTVVGTVGDAVATMNQLRDMKNKF